MRGSSGEAEFKVRISHCYIDETELFSLSDVSRARKVLLHEKWDLVLGVSLSAHSNKQESNYTLCSTASHHLPPQEKWEKREGELKKIKIWTLFQLMHVASKYTDLYSTEFRQFLETAVKNVEQPRCRDRAQELINKHPKRSEPHAPSRTLLYLIPCVTEQPFYKYSDQSGQ